MRSTFIAVLSLVLAASSGAFAQPGPPANALPSVQLPPELERVLREYEQAWSQNKPSALAALFTSDGIALPSGSPPARGAAQIEAEYAKSAGSPLALRAVAYTVVQDLAYIVGGFGSSPDKPDGGKFVLVLRRAADGQWKIAADIDNANSRSRPPAAEVPSPAMSADGAAIDKLGWLAGCWKSETSEPGSGEQWMSPAGGSMLGTSRTVKDGKTVEHEHMQVRALADGTLVFIAQPSGQQTTTFPLLRISESEAIFENKQHDFPQRVAYRRVDPSALVARIEGERNGTLRVIEFPMKRTPCASTR